MVIEKLKKDEKIAETNPAIPVEGSCPLTFNEIVS